MKFAQKLNILLKIFLLVLLILAVRDLGGLPNYQDQDRAMVVRIVIYPLVSFLTYFVYRRRLRKNKQKNKYPFYVDACLTAVVSVDLLGNVFNLYDSVWWWDDVVHLYMVVPWVLVPGLLVISRVKDKWFLFVSVIAYGLVTSILWEIFEFVTFLYKPNELAVSYRDTMLDLTLALVGTLIGGLICLRIYETQLTNKHKYDNIVK